MKIEKSKIWRMKIVFQVRKKYVRMIRLLDTKPEDKQIAQIRITELKFEFLGNANILFCVQTWKSKECN